jgi:hypothetical protein
MSSEDGKFIYSTINLHDPEPLANKKATLLGWVITFLVISESWHSFGISRNTELTLSLVHQIASWVCVSMRLWVRLKIVRAPGWDDFFVVLYLVCRTNFFTM